MSLRILAALAVLTTSAWAQTEPAVEPAPAATTQAPVAAAPETPAAASVVPTDPTELLAFALANAREPNQCRFAFSRLSATDAHVGWSDADAESVVRFDPRLPVGERFVVERATRNQRGMQRAYAREDRKALPFDLINLVNEGEFTYDNPTVARELPDRILYSYVPNMVAGRSSSETGEGIVEQLVGELEVSRETGRIISNTLREPPAGAVRALGIVRVHQALLRTEYAPSTSDYQLAQGGSQMLAMSALLTQTAVTTSFRISDVEAICDPAEVTYIQEAEATALTSRR